MVPNINQCVLTRLPDQNGKEVVRVVVSDTIGILFWKKERQRKYKFFGSGAVWRNAVDGTQLVILWEGLISSLVAHAKYKGEYK